MCILRCGEKTENEFGLPVFVGKPVCIYTKTSPFIEIWEKNSKFSQLYVVGTLNLCLETPGTMQKKSGQSGYPVERKRPTHSKFWGYFEITKSDHVLEVFSGHGDLIELIPFALCQASQYTSLEYPQQISARTFNFGL
jgi:hypothetical protein